MAREGSKRGPNSRRNGATYPFDDFEGSSNLMSLIMGAAIEGGAIRVGLTRDGGALAIGVYLGDDYGTEYVRPDEDLSMALREISMGWSIPMAIWDDEAGRWILR